MTAAILSVGTTHPWNIAGVGRDWSVSRDHGVACFTVIAAVSAQDDRTLAAVEALSPVMVRAQLESVPWERIGAVRVGALGSAENVRVTAEAIVRHAAIVAVVDPVVRTSGGEALDVEETLPVVAASLATLPNVILTPNLDEAAALLGVERLQEDELVSAAERLRARGGAARRSGRRDGNACLHGRADSGTDARHRLRAGRSLGLLARTQRPVAGSGAGRTILRALIIGGTTLKVRAREACKAARP
jgi:hydroxymethylpyrimidine/phosphomethylpyrimidine kinase